jgi:hypothetical protein
MGVASKMAGRPSLEKGHRLGLDPLRRRRSGCRGRLRWHDNHDSRRGRRRLQSKGVAYPRVRVFPQHIQNLRRAFRVKPDELPDQPIIVGRKLPKRFRRRRRIPGNPCSHITIPVSLQSGTHNRRRVRMLSYHLANPWTLIVRETAESLNPG